MRTREMSYTDYGLTKADVIELKNLCRKSESIDLLAEAANKANPEISKMLIYSLSRGKSYEMTDCKMYIPIKKDDFYGYRRKTLAILKTLRNVGTNP